MIQIGKKFLSKEHKRARIQGLQMLFRPYLDSALLAMNLHFGNHFLARRYCA